jgi:hypothetical protein
MSDTHRTFQDAPSSARPHRISAVDAASYYAESHRVADDARDIEAAQLIVETILESPLYLVLLDEVSLQLLEVAHRNNMLNFLHIPVLMTIKVYGIMHVRTCYEGPDADFIAEVLKRYLDRNGSGTPFICATSQTTSL